MGTSVAERSLDHVTHLGGPPRPLSGSRCWGNHPAASSRAAPTAGAIKPSSSQPERPMRAATAASRSEASDQRPTSGSLCKFRPVDLFHIADDGGESEQCLDEIISDEPFRVAQLVTGYLPSELLVELACDLELELLRGDVPLCGGFLKRQLDSPRRVASAAWRPSSRLRLSFPGRSRANVKSQARKTDPPTDGTASSSSENSDPYRARTTRVTRLDGGGRNGSRLRDTVVGTMPLLVRRSEKSVAVLTSATTPANREKTTRSGRLNRTRMYATTDCCLCTSLTRRESCSMTSTGGSES